MKLCWSWGLTSWISWPCLQPMTKREPGCVVTVSQGAWHISWLPLQHSRASSEVLVGIEEGVIGLGQAGHQVRWCVSQCGQGKGRAQSLGSMPVTTDRTQILICFCNLLLLHFASTLNIKQIKTMLCCFAFFLFSFFSSDVFIFLLFPLSLCIFKNNNNKDRLYEYADLCFCYCF